MSYAFPTSDTAGRTGVRYEIRWRRVTEILAMSASAVGVIAFVFLGT